METQARTHVLILLDTHSLLWADLSSTKLGTKARKRIDMAGARGELAFPSIALFEVGLLIERRRISLRTDIRTWRSALLERGLVELTVDGAVAMRAIEVQLGTNDPFDRIVVATALVKDCTLATADAAILGWRGELKRLDVRE